MAGRRFTPETRRRVRVRMRTLRRFLWTYPAPPRTTRALVLVLVIMHLLCGVVDFRLGRTDAWGIVFGERSAVGLARLGGRVRAQVDVEPWRLVSYGLLHGNLVHLTFNAVALWGLGRLAEVVYGPTRMLALFFGSVLGGGALSQLGSAPLAVGASGGVFGLMGALAVFGLRGRAEMPRRLRHVFTRQMVPWIVLNLVIGAALPFIDNLGHLGGLVTGVGGGMIARTELLAERDETRAQRVGSRLLVAVLVIVAFAGPVHGLIG